MNGPLLSAPLLGGRVLELAPEGRAWQLSVTQIDGKDRRQVGGFDLTPDEITVPAYAQLPGGAARIRMNVAAVYDELKAVER